MSSFIVARVGNRETCVCVRVGLLSGIVGSSSRKEGIFGVAADSFPCMMTDASNTMCTRIPV